MSRERHTPFTSRARRADSADALRRSRRGRARSLLLASIVALLACSSFWGSAGIDAQGTTHPSLQYFGGNGQADTRVSIDGERFLINGIPTNAGREWEGVPVEGLLLNSRMVLGTYDDIDGRPPSGMLPWDARINTGDFLAQMPRWADRGLNAITLNLQGGSNKCHGLSGDGQIDSVDNNPYGSSGIQAFDDWRQNRNTPHARHLARLGSIIRTADDLGMAVILGLFYFGQDDGLRNESAVRLATDAAVDWILENRWTNVLIEINNEAGLSYDHDILKPSRVHELMQRVKSRSSGAAGAHLPHRRLLVSASLKGGAIPSNTWISNADFVLLHGNGRSASAISGMVDDVRDRSAWRASPKPIVFNEDSTNTSNFRAAVRRYASWGYYDDEGYQCAFPTTSTNRWTVEQATNQGFWTLLQEMTGGSGGGGGDDAQRVDSLTLIDADRDQPIAGYEQIRSATTINLRTLPTRRLNLRANTAPSTVGSVTFTYDGRPHRTETSMPYTFAGDSGGDYEPWTPSVGAHTVVATPYTSADGNGVKGTPLTITLTVIDEDAPAPPPPTPSGPLVSFTLIDADRDAPIPGFDPMPNGAVLDLGDLPTPRLNIRANANGAVGSVRFVRNGEAVRVETDAPFAKVGDDNGNYHAWHPDAGAYTLVATPFSEPKAQGEAGAPLTISFSVRH